MRIHRTQRNGFNTKVALIGSQTPCRFASAEADVEATGPLNCCGWKAAVRCMLQLALLSSALSSHCASIAKACRNTS
jgi:hypothetical protein